MRKKISDVQNSCSFCVIKDNELKKKDCEIQRLETKLKVIVDGKPKKEYTEEQKQEKEKKKKDKHEKKELKKKEKEEQTQKYKSVMELNETLKKELLKRFGVAVE